MSPNSRREFLKTVAAGSIAARFSTPGRIVTAQPLAVVGPGEVAITLTINGRAYPLAVEPRLTLLDALRTRLDLCGTKRVCDRGSCGACTVIVDGRTYHACTVLAIEAVGRNIRTIEGLAQGATLHPVQQAFRDHDAVMCGFCTPGCVMSVVALRESNPAPSVDQAQRALDGHLCRCGAHVGLLAATLDAKAGMRG